MWTRRLAMVVFGLVASRLSPPVQAGVVADTGFTDTLVVASDEIALATAFAWAPDGSNRIFVTLQTGVVRIVKDGALLPTPFATVTPVLNFRECGLLSVEFDPNFLVNKYVYFFVTVSQTEQQIIRYRVDGDVGVDKTVLIDKLPTEGIIHNGGGMAFGPDGKLYFAIGDNSRPQNTDDLTTLAGKLNRANPDGTPAAGNPFADGAGPKNEYIFAQGFRNPYTMIFQPATGLPWVNVVGEKYEQAFIVRPGVHAGWNVMKYENNQPAGFLRPHVRYRSNLDESWPLAAPAASGAVRAGGTVTFKTVGEHGLRVGDRILITGAADPSFNVRLAVATVPSATSFTAPQAGPDAVSGGGQANIIVLGGVMVGGAFYDATAFPASYRGNFIVGDYNRSALLLAALDPTTNEVTSFGTWGSGHGLLIDVSVGPDGGLYLLHHQPGSIYRFDYTPTAQGIVVSQTHLWMAEGQALLTMVRLARDPGAPTTVSVTRASGDADVEASTTGSTTSTLTFTSANWSRPQPIRFAAARDLDTTDDDATFTISTAGVPAETVSIRVRDDNALALRASALSATVPEGGSTTINVTLSEAPALDVVVTARSLSGKLVTEGAPLTFTYATWNQPQTIKVTAPQDADGSDDSDSIEVSASGIAPVVLAFTTDDDDPADAGSGPDLDAGAMPDLDAHAEVAPADVGGEVRGGGDAGNDVATPADAGGDTRGNADAVTIAPEDDGGCGCRVGGRRGREPAGAFLIVGILSAAAAYRRRRRAR